eukprot:Mycagemm_TRINITY_DN10216_c0_g1::TRINITY_DN10216_c0_g1_i1::g.4313::m.4313 type:complete len:185 gc:universal TRINITY_DN10216_c0_g1_i1:1392-838(-)
MMSMHWSSSSFEITRGGAKRMMWSCVGFASRPASFSITHRSQADTTKAGSITTALRRPLPRTVCRNVNRACIARSSLRRYWPSSSAFSANFSSRRTSSEASATADPRGLPPNVEPCSPGLMHSITSLEARMQLTGNTPPPSALPRMTMSGLKPSQSQASSLPVLQRPVWISSAMKSTLCFLQSS